MSLVIAIEPDPKQAAIVKRLVRERVGADVILADSKDAALAALRQRMPDLILVSALLSPRDEADLTDRLRELDEAEHLQTLTIPLLATGPRAAPEEKGGLLAKFTKKKPSAVPKGCEPGVFAEQIRGYLERASEVRTTSAARRERERAEAKQASIEAARLAEAARLEAERLEAERAKGGQPAEVAIDQDPWITTATVPLEVAPSETSSLKAQEAEASISPQKSDPWTVTHAETSSPDAREEEQRAALLDPSRSGEIPKEDEWGNDAVELSRDLDRLSKEEPEREEEVEPLRADQHEAPLPEAQPPGLRSSSFVQARRSGAEAAEAQRPDIEAREAEAREVAPPVEAQKPQAEKAERLGQEALEEALRAARLEVERAKADRLKARRLEAQRQKGVGAAREPERPKAERAGAAKREAGRAEAEPPGAAKREAGRAEGERREAAKREAERVEAERREAAKHEAERVEAERREAAKHEAERQEAERREAARREAERAEAARLEAERQAAERLEAARREAERLEAEAAARREAERLEAVRREAARLEAERLEAEAAARREAERAEAARRDAARREAERLEAERREAARRETERLEAARRETERLAAEQREAARREAERLEQLEAARRETERLAAERREAERLAAERREAARRETERLEQLEAARRDAERLVAERREAARREAERLEQLEAARREEERLETERLEAARREVQRLEQAKAARRETKHVPESGRDEGAAKPEIPQPDQPPARSIPREGGWIEHALDALRMEIQRLRTDRSDKLPAAKPSDVAAQPDSASVPTRKGKKSTAAKATKPKPLQDEWGIYDPSQAGFDALFAKIEEVSEGQEIDEDDDLADQLIATKPSSQSNEEGQVDPADMLLAQGSSSSAAPTRTQAPPPRRPGFAPLAMWARSETPQAATAKTSEARDHLRALMGQLQLPSAVASVSYPTGCRIRHIRVTPHQTKRKAKSDEPLVIVSRKRLRKLRASENAVK